MPKNWLNQWHIKTVQKYNRQKQAVLNGLISGSQEPILCYTSKLFPV